MAGRLTVAVARALAAYADDDAEAPRPRLGERVLTAVSRDPLTAPRRLRHDALIALGAGAVTVALALTVGSGRTPDLLGWLLLGAGTAPLAWRRRRPVLVLAAVLACAVAYHAADYTHAAPHPATVLALYTVAATARPLLTFVIGAGVIGATLAVMFRVGTVEGAGALWASGWILAVLIFGVDVRTYRRYIASVVARAERAERTREEEAARRVAQERLRIARDLHDLLAHSITLIGVRTAVASHVLTADPDRLDRAAVATALDEIAETCRTARQELRTTLQVLRDEEGQGDGPLPGLEALPALVRAAGAELEIRPPTLSVAAATGAAVYRIVQESLTNAVRHAGPDAPVRVTVAADDPAGPVRLTVTDDGVPQPAAGGAPGAGFGIAGMRERARSAGGTLSAGPRECGGFEVAAVLPLKAGEPTA
ncbi:sensor histidine kinase [Streptomyces sp. NPDC127084]|uniref:sensor histidine kinase n=1 Tax=Streptomyces sp. NPDC127084 TaxID=3347133 RepID=UPI00364FBE80